MTKPRLPAFDPADLAESNATSYPPKFKAINSRRWNRRLGDHVGLKNFGVNLTRIEPGGQTSARHAHTKQDDEVNYPDIDNHGKAGADGKYVFTKKDGSPH
jgi:hypothetical protein